MDKFIGTRLPESLCKRWNDYVETKKKIAEKAGEVHLPNLKEEFARAITEYMDRHQLENKKPA